MIIQTKLLQDSCKKILDAVDTSSVQTVAETLELELVDKLLKLNVTNREYFVSVNIPVDIDEKFDVVVDAKMFLNLICKLTTKEVELTVADRYLSVKANGSYKVPFIADRDGNVLKLPKITIENVTDNFKINSEVLQSILKYNSKELLKSGCNKAVQKLFYMDGVGALTFNKYGGCVNSFTLEHPVSLFLNEKIIKLFKLFKSDVEFFIGHDLIENTQKTITKVAFRNDTVTLVSILNIDESLTSSFPVKAIRDLAETSYEYTVNLNKDLVLDALSRLYVLDKSMDGSETLITFTKNYCILSDKKCDNVEEIPYNATELDLAEGEYKAIFNTLDLKLTLETFEEPYVNLSFGNHRAAIASRGHIINIIAECKQ